MQIEKVVTGKLDRVYVDQANNWVMVLVDCGDKSHPPHLFRAVELPLGQHDLEGLVGQTVSIRTELIVAQKR